MTISPGPAGLGASKPVSSVPGSMSPRRETEDRLPGAAGTRTKPTVTVGAPSPVQGARTPPFTLQSFPRATSGRRRSLRGLSPPRGQNFRVSARACSNYFSIFKYFFQVFILKTLKKKMQMGRLTHTHPASIHIQQWLAFANTRYLSTCTYLYIEMFCFDKMF